MPVSCLKRLESARSELLAAFEIDSMEGFPQRSRYKFNGFEQCLDSQYIENEFEQNYD